MSALAATCVNTAIDHLGKAAVAEAALYCWTAICFDGDRRFEDQIKAFRAQLYDLAAEALQDGATDEASRIDAFGALFDPTARLRIAPAEARRRVDAACSRAALALEAERYEVVAVEALAALSFDPSAAAADQLRAVGAEGLVAKAKCLGGQQPSLEATLALAAGVAAGASEARSNLMDLLSTLGDFPTVLTLCDQIEATGRLSPDATLDVLRRRTVAQHRLQGGDPASAEAAAAESARRWATTLGDAESLSTDALRLRVTLCFGYGGFRQTLDDLRTLKRRSPDDPWVSYNLCVALNSALHPEVAASADSVVRSASDAEADLVVRYTILRTIGAMPQALSLAARLARHKPEYAAIPTLHAMATGAAAPSIRLGRPPRGGSGRRLIYANLVCWGASYIDLMEQAAIPSLLASQNFPTLAQTADLVVDLFTTPADLPRLRASSALERLAEVCEIRIFTLPDPVIPHLGVLGYAPYCFASHATIHHAERDGADLIFLFPDVVYADGCYARVAKGVEIGARALFVDGLNAYAQPMLDQLRPHRENGVLTVPPQSLIDAAVSCLTLRSLNSIYRPNERLASTQVTRVILPVATGLRAHSFMLLPAYVRHDAFAPVVIRDFGTPDGRFVEHVLDYLADHEVVVMSGQEFCFVEICDHDGSVRRRTPKDIVTGIRDSFVDFVVGRRRRLCFFQPIDFPMSSPVSAIADPIGEADAAALMAAIRQVFDTDPSMVDLAVEQERARARSYRQAR